LLINNNLTKLVVLNNLKMRPLNDEETKVLFTKLADYIGPNVKFLIDREDEAYVFRLIKDKVYYMSEKLMKLSTNFGRDNFLQY
jgi:60S ribosome subunit biogenesis protein NIP7